LINFKLSILLILLFLCLGSFASASPINKIKNIVSNSISETTQIYFVDKKSKVLEKFQNIDIVKRAENINVEQIHQAATNKIYKTTLCCLKQTSFDGYFSCYRIISNSLKHQEIEIFQNLFNGKILYIDSCAADRNVIISIKAITKKVLNSEVIDVKVIYNKINLEQEYEAGTYFITTFANDEQVLFYKRLLFFNEIVSCV